MGWSSDVACWLGEVQGSVGADCVDVHALLAPGSSIKLLEILYIRTVHQRDVCTRITYITAFTK